MKVLTSIGKHLIQLVYTTAMIFPIYIGIAIVSVTLNGIAILIAWAVSAVMLYGFLVKYKTPFQHYILIFPMLGCIISMLTMVVILHLFYVMGNIGIKSSSAVTMGWTPDMVIREAGMEAVFKMLNYFYLSAALLSYVLYVMYVYVASKINRHRHEAKEHENLS